MNCSVRDLVRNFASWTLLLFQQSAANKVKEKSGACQVDKNHRGATKTHQGMTEWVFIRSLSHNRGALLSSVFLVHLDKHIWPILTFWGTEASAAWFHSDGPCGICNLSEGSEPWLPGPVHTPVKQIVQLWRITAGVQKTFTDLRYCSAYQKGWKKTEIVDKNWCFHLYNES